LTPSFGMELSHNVVSNVPQCTRTADDQFLQLFNILENTDVALPFALHASYVLYGSCDDGSVYEGYSELIVKALADHPAFLSGLISYMEADQPFAEFVLKHLRHPLFRDINQLRHVK